MSEITRGVLWIFAIWITSFLVWLGIIYILDAYRERRRKVADAAIELLDIMDGLDIDPDLNYRLFYAKRRLERLVGKAAK